MFRHLALSAFILITIASNALGQGESGLTFLKLGVGGRSAGMGEAAVAAATDAAAAFYNPAALSLTAGTDLLFMHRVWIQDARMQYAAVSTRISNLVLGAHLNNVSIDDIEVRTVPGPAISTTSLHDAAIGVSAALELDESFSAGVSADFLYEKIYTDDASGYAFSFGGLYRFSPSLRAGLSINNLGTMNELQQEAPELPTSVRGGAAYEVQLADARSRLTAAVDLVKYRGDNSVHIHAGAEFAYQDVLFIRGGYVSGYESRSITGGLGLALEGFRLDYAVLPFRYDLGTSHTISIAYTFN
jgi:hypothetical protein